MYQQRAERKAEKRRVEFFVDADIVAARSVDRSETGIRIVTETPIQVSMRVYQSDDEWTDYQANLCWAAREQDGHMAYGLEFVEEPDW
jgi:hypothetical protein